MPLHLITFPHTAAQLSTIDANKTAVSQQFYFDTDNSRYYYGKLDGSLAGPLPAASGIGAISDTTTIDLDDASGSLQAHVRLSGTAGNILSVDGVNGLFLADLSIAPASQPYLSYNPTTREISLQALGITSVSVDNSAASLAAFVTANYSSGNEYQEGDTIILTLPGSAYIHNGGSNGDASDFTAIETPGLTSNAIRALFSAGNSAIDYNAATGAFSLQLDPAGPNDLSLTAGGLLLDVSAAPVIDTHNIAGGGSQSVQALFNAIAANTPAGGFANGIGLVGNKVELGGNPLNKNTQLALGSFDLGFTGAGKLTIGGSSGLSKFNVFGGDMEVVGSSNGLILASPNGQRWRITINNIGALQTANA